MFPKSTKHVYFHGTHSQRSPISNDAFLTSAIAELDGNLLVLVRHTDWMMRDRSASVVLRGDRVCERS